MAGVVERVSRVRPMTAVAERPKGKARTRPRTLEELEQDLRQRTAIRDELHERLTEVKQECERGDTSSLYQRRELQDALSVEDADIAIVRDAIEKCKAKAAAQQQVAREAAAAAVEQACYTRAVHTQAKFEGAWAAVPATGADHVAAFAAWDQARAALARVRGVSDLVPSLESGIRTRQLGVPGDPESMRIWQDRLGELTLRSLVGGHRPRWGGRRRGAQTSEVGDQHGREDGE